VLIKQKLISSDVPATSPKTLKLLFLYRKVCVLFNIHTYSASFWLVFQWACTAELSEFHPSTHPSTERSRSSARPTDNVVRITTEAVATPTGGNLCLHRLVSGVGP